MKEIICKGLHHNNNNIRVCINSIVGQPTLWSAEKGFNIIKSSLASFEYYCN